MDDVPFNELARETAALEPQLREAIQRVVSSGWYVLGPENEGLEAELATYIGTRHCVTVANGTDALQLALCAVGVGAGDTVLTAANAGGYASTAVRALGAIPAYVDVDPESLLLTRETLEAASDRMPRRPSALVVTHLYGRTAEMGPLVRWAKDLGVPLLEDCAQAVGATYAGARAGSLGDVAATSFYPTKNLGALGDGGAVLTSDPELAARVRRLRQYGWETKYVATSAHGRNSRMDEIQAAVVRSKLPLVDEWNSRRREIHSAYEQAVPAGVSLVNASGPEFVAHLGVVTVPDRQRAVAHFADSGIRTDVHYPVPDHQQPIAEGTAHISLPVTERAAGSVLSLPLFPWLRPDEVDRVASALAQVPA